MVNLNNTTPAAPSGSVNVAWQHSGIDVSASVPIGGGGITALTGDVTASGSGSVAATVALVAASTAANVHAAELLANAATNANTASTIVKRDASGNFIAGTITAALTGNASGSAASFTGALAGDVTGTQAATSVVKVNGAAVPSSQSVLGSNGSGQLIAGSAVGIPGIYATSLYTFTVSPAGTLASGSNKSITLPGICPAGVNGTDVGHWVRISAGGSTAETVLINGGTAVAGVLGGTLQFATVSYSHTGYTITSANQGIEEAVVAAATAYPYGGATVIIDYPYTLEVRAPAYIPVSMTIEGGIHLELETATGIAFRVEANGCKFRNINVWSTLANTQTAGSCAIQVGGTNKVYDTWVENCCFWDMYDGVLGVKSQRLRVTNCYFANFLHTGITAGDSTVLAQDQQVLYASGNSYFNQTNLAPALASIYLTSGWAVIVGEDGTMYDDTQAHYGVYGNFTTASSATRIVGCTWAYYDTAGIRITVTGSGILYTYVTISGNIIHNENLTSANTGIKLSVASSGILSDVNITGNVIQGYGSAFTAIDVTGVTELTLGPNNITFMSGTAGVSVVGASGAWTSMVLQGTGPTLWAAVGGNFVPAYKMSGDGMIHLCGSATVANFTSPMNVAQLPYLPAQQIDGSLTVYDSTAATWNVGLWTITAAGMLLVYAPITAGHAAKIWLDDIDARMS